MDTNKFYEFFQPETCKDTIHIVGCGAVGSTVAELLVRMGLTKFKLYDFDTVESHNIANQMFRTVDLHKKKTDALKEIMMEINPEVDVTTVEKYNGEQLNGYVFMAIDSIATRRNLVESNMYNPFIKAMFDTRISLTDAQGYAARWDKHKEKQNLLNTMNFTDEEARAVAPVSACNMELSVAPTVRLICNYIVANFINLLQKKEEKFKTIILLQDAFDCQVSAF